MKIYDKFKKIICCALLLIVLSLTCSGCRFSITTERSSSSSSQSSSSKESSSSTGNFALKYKDQEMDFDEYLCIVASMIISSKEQTKNIGSTNTASSSSSSEDEYKIKMASVQLAKVCLIVREKSNQLSADLEEKTKKLVESSCSDTQIAEESQALGFNRYALRKCAEDVARIIILKKQNFDPGKLMSENQVTVNYEITNKVNIDQLVKNIEKYIKDGGKFIELDEKILQQKTI